MKVRFLKNIVLCLLILVSPFALSDGSQTISKGSAQISKGSIEIGEEASQLFATAAAGSVQFVVDFIEVAGETAEVVLITGSEVATTSATVTVSMTSAAVASLAISAGAVLDVIQIAAEDSAIVLGYLLMDGDRVLLFVAPEASPLTLHRQSI
ncbi:MAG: hypothetical protein Cons2KO_26190 [Congregibacter sp.]